MVRDDWNSEVAVSPPASYLGDHGQAGQDSPGLLAQVQGIEIQGFDLYSWFYVMLEERNESKSPSLDATQ